MIFTHKISYMSVAGESRKTRIETGNPGLFPFSHAELQRSLRKQGLKHSRGWKCQQSGQYQVAKESKKTRIETGQ